MSKYILAYMDFASPTGFSMVSKSILDRLTPWLQENDIKVDLYALNFGLKEDYDYNSQIKVLNPLKFEGAKTKDPYARLGFLRILKVGAYDLVWMLNDIDVVSPMMPYVEQIQEYKQKEGRTPFKTLFYTPIDSPPLYDSFKNLKSIDQIVTYTEYAKNEMYKAFIEIGIKPLNTIRVVPHGMDTSMFFPITDVDKNTLREKHDLPKDVFLFGNVNKNQSRKDIGTTLIAFADFKKDFGKGKGDVALYLHCYHLDPTGINILRVCKQLGLEVGKDVFYPTNNKYLNAEYTTQDMNEIYNCLDVFVSTTMSEGWGLTITEAMCVGLPIICPLHTSLTEITDEGALTHSHINTYRHIQINDAEFIRYKSHPKHVAGAMNDAYLDAKIQTQTSRLSKYRHKFEEYNWDKIAKQFQTYISNLIK